MALNLEALQVVRWGLRTMVWCAITETRWHGKLEAHWRG